MLAPGIYSAAGSRPWQLREAPGSQSTSIVPLLALITHLVMLALTFGSARP
jgi:hypothetical protein